MIWSTPDPSTRTRYTPAAVKGVGGRVVVVGRGVAAAVAVVGGEDALVVEVVLLPAAWGRPDPVEAPPSPPAGAGSTTTPIVVLVVVDCARLGGRGSPEGRSGPSSSVDRTIAAAEPATK